jgi:hypothetical protein
VLFEFFFHLLGSAYCEVATEGLGEDVERLRAVLRVGVKEGLEEEEGILADLRGGPSMARSAHAHACIEGRHGNGVTVGTGDYGAGVEGGEEGRHWRRTKEGQGDGQSLGPPR